VQTVIMRILHSRSLYRAFICGTIALVMLPTTPVRATNDELATELRADLPAVYNAGDYYTSIWDPGNASGIQTGDFVTAWLGVDTLSYNGGFFQVGIMQDYLGVHWFAYSYDNSLPTTCLRGNRVQYSQGSGCNGTVGDLALYGGWTAFEIYHNAAAGTWVARVYQTGNGNVWADVASYAPSSSRVYRVEQNSEEGYGEVTDPLYNLDFYHADPYYQDASSGWTLWPLISGGYGGLNSNSFTALPSNVCPTPYGARWPFLAGDSRSWDAGEDYLATTCFGVVF
jgi:hypothetical protein